MKKFLNKIHNIDIHDLLRQLPDESIDMVYSDIDYNKGIRYHGKTYSKNFNEYITDYISLAAESTRVLKKTGSAFFINYPKNNAHLWVQYLDKAYYDTQEYVWVYNSNIGHSPRRFTTAHRSILHCMKSKNNKFFKDQVAEPYINETDKRIRRLIKEGSKGRSPYSWQYADMVKNVTKGSKKIDHPCVIPDRISSMLIQSVTEPGDVVLILFAGSGSEIDVCRKLGRNWISADLSEDYCEFIEKRLDNEILLFEESTDDNS
jgi:DNA modification methylase